MSSCIASSEQEPPIKFISFCTAELEDSSLDCTESVASGVDWEIAVVPSSSVSPPSNMALMYDDLYGPTPSRRPTRFHRSANIPVANAIEKKHDHHDGDDDNKSLSLGMLEEEKEGSLHDNTNTKNHHSGTWHDEDSIALYLHQLEATPRRTKKMKNKKLQQQQKTSITAAKSSFSGSPRGFRVALRRMSDHDTRGGTSKQQSPRSRSGSPAWRKNIGKKLQQFWSCKGLPFDDENSELLLSAAAGTTAAPKNHHHNNSSSKTTLAAPTVRQPKEGGAPALLSSSVLPPNAKAAPRSGELINITKRVGLKKQGSEKTLTTASPTMQSSISQLDQALHESFGKLLLNDTNTTGAPTF